MKERETTKQQFPFYLHSTAPLPPQFLQTALSLPSKAIASVAEVGLPKSLITDAVEHKHVRQ